MVEKKEGFNWKPLESDPQIFTELLQSIGLNYQWGFSEVYGLDQDLLSMIPQPVIAIILICEFLLEETDEQKKIQNSKSYYYMKQTEVLDNACGTIAMLHSVFNNQTRYSILDQNSVLLNYYEKVKNLNSLEKAKTLENYKEIQDAHNKFAVQGQSQQPQCQSDVRNHFVCFALNEDNEVIELDGMRDGGAKKIAEKINPDDLALVVSQEILSRISKKIISDQIQISALCKLGQE